MLNEAAVRADEQPTISQAQLRNLVQQHDVREFVPDEFTPRIFRLKVILKSHTEGKTLISARRAERTWKNLNRLVDTLHAMDIGQIPVRLELSK